MLGFTALALASPILKHAPHILTTSLELPSDGELVHGIVSGRGLIATPPIAAFQASPKTKSISGTNTTAQGPASSAFPSHVSFTLPQQSQWGPGAISSVLFGCVASILGAIGVGITYFLYRRQSRTQESGSWTTVVFFHHQVANSMINRWICCTGWFPNLRAIKRWQCCTTWGSSATRCVCQRLCR